MSGGALHHIAHTVNQTHFHIDAVTNLDLCCLLWYKFRLCGRDGAPAAALWQFVLRACPLMLIFNLRQYHQIHKSFNKCGFSRSDRPHYANIDFPAGALADIPV